MRKLPAIHFYPGDWLRDAISGCSLEAQGLWLRMMFIMHDNEKYGHLEAGGKPLSDASIARRCGCDILVYVRLLKELVDAGVPSIKEGGVLYSRRMVRDYAIREIWRKNGNKGGRPSSVKSNNNRHNQKITKGITKHITKSKPKTNPTPEDDNDNESEDVYVNDVVKDVVVFSKELDLLIPEDLKHIEIEINEWLAYKHEKGQKYKPLGLRQLWENLRKIPESMRKASIQQSMANNWSGIFPAKGDINGERKNISGAPVPGGKYAGIGEQSK